MPLATAVGTVAAYAGGLADDLSMRVVDVVRTVLPVIAYITTTSVLGGTGSLALMIALFSLLSWGSVARLVRNDALSRTDEPYVTAAENASASPWSVVRRHLTPNVTGSVLAATTLQIPALLLAEIALSYLDLGARYIYSWDTLVRRGTSGAVYGSLLDTRWISLVPVVTPALTVLSLGVLGETVDPRTG